MIINATLARLLYRRHIGGGQFPAFLTWRLLTHLETLPEGENVYAFVVEDRLCAITGTQKTQAKQESGRAA